MNSWLIWFFFSKQLNTIWVSCEGENPADIENMGPIEYYPRQGFPGYYFPYENSEGYLSPLVAIHFTSPNRKLNEGIRLESNRNSSVLFCR